jgi:hypothetical protein
MTNLDWTQACDKATWMIVFQKMGPDVYTVEEAGEVSLVDRDTLIGMIFDLFGGGNRELGGGPVG